MAQFESQFSLSQIPNDTYHVMVCLEILKGSNFGPYGAYNVTNMFCLKITFVAFMSLS